MTVDYQPRHALPSVPLNAVAKGKELSTRRMSPWRHMTEVGPWAVGWYGLGAVSLLADSDLPMVGDTRAVFALSSAALLFGVWVYWRHGGSVVTGVGIYNFAFALFVGFAGLNLLFTDSADGNLLYALAWCYFGQVTIWLLFWTKDPPLQPARPRIVDPAYLDRVTWIGLIFTCGGAVASLELVGSMRHLGQAAGFVGTVLVAVSLLNDERRGPLLGSLLAAAGFALSMATSNSYGRLMLGALGLALLVVISRRLRTRAVKAGSIVCSVPILSMFGNMRKEEVGANQPDIQFDGTGLESVASPLDSFGKLLEIDAAGALAYSWGDTFLVALVSLVPRSLWPSKPSGFGAELVLTLHPEMAHSGHSDAALFQGEWLYNFGIVGLVLMLPVVGLGVWAADWFMARVAVCPLVGRRALLRYGAAIIVLASLPDLAWGTFTFTVRVGMRLMMLVAASFLIAERRIE